MVVAMTTVFARDGRRLVLVRENETDKKKEEGKVYKRESSRNGGERWSGVTTTTCRRKKGSGTRGRRGGETSLERGLRDEREREVS